MDTALEECTTEALGKKVNVGLKRLVRLEVKSEKWENRIVALTDHRVYIITPKHPAKVEHNIPYLDLQGIESKNQSRLSLSTEGRKIVLSTHEDTSKDINHVITHIAKSISAIFPKVSLEQVVGPVKILPEDRMTRMMAEVKSQETDIGPCGGFTAMYATVCDYLGLPYMEDVAWDVDTIYLSQDSRELNLGDFDHFDGKHLVPIIAALEYNHWFTKLNANNIRLTTDTANEILKIMKRNTALQELHLSGIGIKWDFAQKLSSALLANPSRVLTTLDLSGNLIEDRGVNLISGAVSTLSLVHLNLAKTGLTAKGVNKLADAMFSNRSLLTSLQFLDLSDNSFKGEDITNLLNFLAQPNKLKTLRLSGNDCALEMSKPPEEEIDDDPRVMFGALSRGCWENITHLDLSRNFYSTRRTRDPHPSIAWKTFFARQVSLKYLNLSANKLPAETLKMVLLGIASNEQRGDIELDLSQNDLRSAGAQVLDSCLPCIRSITSLDISDNALDSDLCSLCEAITKNTSIRKLALGKNFHTKPKLMSQVLDAIVEMIQDENSQIESLSLTDSKLKTETTLIINALGSNSSLTEIDISGNQMGDMGARMLAKALQLNTKLRTIYWDHNNTTAQGFQDIAFALQKNYTMRKMPTPIQDATAALKLAPEKTEKALEKIESLLQRNHEPRKIASDQGYRLQQGILSSAQNMVDRNVAQIEEQIQMLGKYELSEKAAQDIAQASRLCQDAAHCKQLLQHLHGVMQKSEASAIEAKLSTVANELQNAIHAQLQSNVSDMMKVSENNCPTVMRDHEFKHELRETCTEKTKTGVSTDLTRNLLMGQVSTDIMNRVSEVNLAVAAHMSDRLMDGVLDSLEAASKTLTNHVNSQHTGSLSDTPALVKTPEKVIPDEPKEILLLKKQALIPEDSPQSTLKKKTLYSRRLRPQSVIDAQEVKRALKLTGNDTADKSANQITEEEHANEGAAVTNGRVVHGGVAMASKSNKVAETSEDENEKLDTGKVNNDEVDGASATKRPSLSPVPSSPASVSSLSFDDIPSSEAPKLSHLGLARPRRNKKHAPKKAAIMSDKIIEDQEGVVDNGVSEFFEKKAIVKELSSDNELNRDSGRSTESLNRDSGKSTESLNRDSASGKSTESLDEAGKDDHSPSKPDSKKKGWSPFGGNSNPKSLAAGISSFFKKSSPAPKSPELTKREAAPSPDVSRRISSGSSREELRDDLPDHNVESRVQAGPVLMARSPRTTEKRHTPAGDRKSYDGDKEDSADDLDERRSDDDEDISPRMHALPKIGLPGMGGGGASALMAELKSKRASMKQPAPSPVNAAPSPKSQAPLPSNKADNKENRDGRSSSFGSSDSRNKENLSPALKSALSQSPAKTDVSKPVPIPRSSSPASRGDKTHDKSSEDSNGPSAKTRPPPPTKPRPPPVAPKPRPVSKVPSTSSRVSMPPATTPPSRPGSESIGERASPSSPPCSDSTRPDPRESVEPPRLQPTRRRLSVKEKVAALDRNSNEQPEVAVVRRPSLRATSTDDESHATPPDSQLDEKMTPTPPPRRRARPAPQPPIAVIEPPHQKEP